MLYTPVYIIYYINSLIKFLIDVTISFVVNYSQIHWNFKFQIMINDYATLRN